MLKSLNLVFPPSCLPDSLNLEGQDC